MLAAEAEGAVGHGSGRPWLVGHGIAGMVLTVMAGPIRVAVIGTCLASEAELRTQVEHAVQRGNYDALARLRGSYHIAVTDRTL